MRFFCLTSFEIEQFSEGLRHAAASVIVSQGPFLQLFVDHKFLFYGPVFRPQPPLIEIEMNRRIQKNSKSFGEIHVT